MLTKRRVPTDDRSDNTIYIIATDSQHSTTQRNTAAQGRMTTVMLTNTLEQLAVDFGAKTQHSQRLVLIGA
jgi:hypothetical protein